MSFPWRYYNSKRGNAFRGRGKGGRGRGTGLNTMSLPRQDHFHKGVNNEEYFRDKPLNPGEFSDETVLSLSFGQNMLGAAYYEQSSQLVKIMNDISEDYEFIYLKRLIEDVKPTIIIANRSQDLEFLKFLSSRCAQHEKLDSDEKDTTRESTEDTVQTWDASLAYSTDEQEGQIDADDELCEGPPAILRKLPNNFFKMPRALERLKMMVGSEDTKMTDEEKYMIVTMRFDIEAVNMMRSFGALLFFLDETRLGVENQPLSENAPIKSIKTTTLENLVDIDYNTIQALDILPKEIESKKSTGHNKSLYSLIDRCRSTVGKKCLKKWFRNPTTDREVLISRQKCVHYFKQDWNAEVTAKTASLLGKVKALNSVFQRFQSGSAKLIHWECFVSTVNALVGINNIIRQTPIANELSVESSVIKEVSEVAVIAGSIIDFAESKIQGRVTVMPGIDEDLDRLRDTYENMPMVLTAMAKQEASRFGLPPYSNVTCVYIPLVGFVLSVPRDFPVESYRDMSLVYATSEELRVRNETTERLDNEYGDILMDLIDNQTAIILSLKVRVLKKKRCINKLLAVASRIDALVSMGLVAAENGWNCPTLVDEPVIEALELYHPISVLVVKKNFVPNQVCSGRNGVKASIITGPNACGKSVYMKSIGILAFLSHIGSFVPARHAKVGVVDRIVTRMFTVDSVLDGMSTFAKDVEQVALALRKATGNSLVIIDEFGKGTMTEVGLSLLSSCMTYWMNKGSQKCPHIFLSSHFHALPKYIPLHSNVATFLTFTVLREPEGKIKYLFRLTPGMVDCSFAMAVAREEGIPMSVIGRACRIYKALKSGTPLKKVRAEVSNDVEDGLVADMDVVLENEADFLNAVESFVKRTQKENPNTSKSSSSDGTARRIEPGEESLTRISNRSSEDNHRTRSNSALSTKTMASYDQLSIFDALLPKRKRRVVVPEEKGSEVTIESSRSPDPFSVDDDEDEYRASSRNEVEEVVSKVLVPTLQKLNSEEDREKSMLSRNANTSCYHGADNMPLTPINEKRDARGSTKRPRSPSTCDMSLSTKTARSVLMTPGTNVLETPNQLSRTSSSHTFVAPQLPSLKKTVVDRVLQKTIQETSFKTPTNDRRSKSFVQVTPENRSMNSLSIKLPKDTIKPISSETQNDYDKTFSFTDSEILKSQEPFNSNMTPRSSSRRGMRMDRMIGKAESPKDTNPISDPFSPVGSRFSIFDSPQSFQGNSTQDSNHDMSLFFGTLNTQKKKESQKSKNNQQFVFETPKRIASGKQISFSGSETQISRKSVSPSSAVLGELVHDDLEKTPRPVGDEMECLDFVFNMDDDDPIYGSGSNFQSPVFDFLKSNEDDNSFLKSFPNTTGSLQIDTSDDETSHRFKRN